MILSKINIFQYTFFPRDIEKPKLHDNSIKPKFTSRFAPFQYSPKLYES